MILFIIGLISCNSNNSQGKWIKGSPSQQTAIIELQLRGFDKAMIETDYRYQELYWAGQDENWEYATYLTKKIKKAMETGFQRRPKRATSAQLFINNTLPEMHEAILSKNLNTFNQSFEKMTISCNACHAMEEMAFFTIKTPKKRHSSIRK